MKKATLRSRQILSRHNTLILRAGRATVDKTRVGSAECLAMSRAIEALQRQHLRTPFSHHATLFFSRTSQSVISQKHALSTASSASPPSPSVLGSDLPSRLYGQRLCIPDLWPLFKTWKSGVNQEYQRVKTVVDAQLERLIVGNEKALAEAKRAEPGLCAAAYAPFPSALQAGTDLSTDGSLMLHMMR